MQVGGDKWLSLQVSHLNHSADLFKKYCFVEE